MNISKKILNLTANPKAYLMLAAGLFLFNGLITLSAQTTEPKKKKQLTVEERLDVLAEELEKQKLNKAVKKFKSVGGMGPAASEVYNIDQGFSFGGYGEVKYRDYRSSYKQDQVDVHRFILYTGYKFNDWILLNAEIEYEHAGFESETVVTNVSSTGTATTGSINQSEVFVEFAYIDLKFRKWAQLSAGLLLVPVGVTNYQHEPTTFNSVERPITESNLIPSTWREIGVMLHGELLNGDLYYRTAIMNGPRGKDFSDSSFIRGGRTKGSKAKAEDLAFVANLEYRGVKGLNIGGAYYFGDSGQGDISKVDWQANLTNPVSSLSGGLFDVYNDEFVGNRNKTANVRVHLADVHFKYEVGPFQTRGLFARGWMNEDDTRAVNKKTGENFGMKAEGGYIEVGVNVLHFFRKQTNHKLIVFVRDEYLNTQKETIRRYLGGEEDILDAICTSSLNNTCGSATNANLGIIASGTSAKEAYGVTGVADRVNDRRVITAGLAYFPHPNVVLKLDYETQTSKSSYHADIEWRNSSNNKINRLNMAVGFIF